MNTLKSTISAYTDACKKFSQDTQGWSCLPSTSFFTTRGDGWEESSDNAHDGVDVSWAFKRSGPEIEEAAAGALYELLMEELQVAVDDGWDSEQISAIVEKFKF